MVVWFSIIIDAKVTQTKFSYNRQTQIIPKRN